MLSACALATAAILAVPLPTLAQRVTVAVAINDSATGGIFQSAFADAFRRLVDVRVVGPYENPDFSLYGVILCSVDPCSRAQNYALSLRLVTRAKKSRAETIGRIVLSDLGGSSSKARVDSLTEILWPWLEGYEKSHTTWVARWGRTAYEQAVRELVASIDSGCFEKQRALWRTARRSIDEANQAREQYDAFIRSRSWLC